MISTYRRSERRVGVAPEDEARVAEDARERRAQLVRDDRDQLRLRPLALAQLLVLALRDPGAPDSTEDGHRVERAGQLPDLGRALLRDADREVARGDPRRAASRRRGPDVRPTGRDSRSRAAAGSPRRRARRRRPARRGLPGRSRSRRGAEASRSSRASRVASPRRISPIRVSPSCDAAGESAALRAHERDRDQGVAVVGRVSRGCARSSRRRAASAAGCDATRFDSVGGRRRELRLGLVPALADAVVAREHEAAQAPLELVDDTPEAQGRRGHPVRLHLLVGRAPQVRHRQQHDCERDRDEHAPGRRSRRARAWRSAPSAMISAPRLYARCRPPVTDPREEGHVSDRRPGGRRPSPRARPGRTASRRNRPLRQPEPPPDRSPRQRRRRRRASACRFRCRTTSRPEPPGIITSTRATSGRKLVRRSPSTRPRSRPPRTRSRRRAPRASAPAVRARRRRSGSARLHRPVTPPA